MNDIELKKESSRTAKILAITLWAIALLIFFGLVSNYPDNWASGPQSGQGSNWMGVFGVLSVKMFYFIGIDAYLVPPLLVLIAWRVFFSLNLRTSTNCLIGVCFLLLALSGLISVLLSSGIYGGLLGTNISVGLLSIFGRSGTVVFLVAVIGCSLVLVSDYSFSSIIFQTNNTLNNLRQWQQREHAAAKSRLTKRMGARKMMNKVQV